MKGISCRWFMTLVATSFRMELELTEVKRANIISETQSCIAIGINEQGLNIKTKVVQQPWNVRADLSSDGQRRFPYGLCGPLLPTAALEGDILH